MIRWLLRVAAIIATLSVTILAITGADLISSEDDEIPFALLAALWAAIMVTKPRPHRQ